jgi:hypothetical protein
MKVCNSIVWFTCVIMTSTCPLSPLFFLIPLCLIMWFYVRLCDYVINWHCSTIMKHWTWLHNNRFSWRKCIKMCVVLWEYRAQAYNESWKCCITICRTSLHQTFGNHFWLKKPNVLELICKEVWHLQQKSFFKDAKDKERLYKRRSASIIWALQH